MKSIFFMLLLLTAIPAFSQSEKLQGTIILLWGREENGAKVVRSYQAFEVVDTQEPNQTTLVNELAKKTASFDTVLSSIWKKDMAWQAATTSVKAPKNTNFGSYSQVNNNGQYLDGGPAKYLTGYQPKKEENNYLDELTGNDWASVNKYVKDIENKLIKDGWERQYGAYRLAYRSKELLIGKNVPYKQNMTYTIVAAASTTGGEIQIYRDNTLENSEGKYYFNAGQYGIAASIEPLQTLQTLSCVMLPETHHSSQPGVLLVYARPIDHERDFNLILNDASTGFSNVRARETKDPNGVKVWLGMYGLGLSGRTIYNQKESGKMAYWLSGDINAESKKIAKDVIGYMEKVSKDRKFKLIDGKLGENIVTDLIDENNNQVMRHVIDPVDQKIQIFFYEI